MKKLWIAIAILLGVGAAYFAVLYGASELGGEVVVLHRTSADGSVQRVRVWVVEENERVWIEHGAPDADWITKLEANPLITLERHGETKQYRGFADPGSHAHYHALRAEKYGIADRIVALATADAESCGGVPVRIEAMPP